MTTDPQAESVRRLAEHYASQRLARLTALPTTDPLSDGAGAVAQFTHYAADTGRKSSIRRKPVDVQVIIDGDKTAVDIQTHQEGVIVILNGKTLQEPVGAKLTPAGATSEDIPARMRREAARATERANKLARGDDDVDIDGIVHNLQVFAGTLARGAAELEVARQIAGTPAPDNWRWYVTVECDDDGGAAQVAKDLQQSTGGRVRITEGPKGWQK